MYIVNSNGTKDKVFEWYSVDRVGHMTRLFNLKKNPILRYF